MLFINFRVSVSLNGFLDSLLLNCEIGTRLSATGGTIQFGIQKTILDPLIIDFYLGATYNDDYGIYDESSTISHL